MGGACSAYGGEVRGVQGVGVYRVLVGKTEGKGRLGRPRQRWDDNMTLALQEVGWGGHGID
jgi:nanoRNase/pAp phosphatase (c-di-AMP/oligoRNAs hydrolase)